MKRFSFPVVAVLCFGLRAAPGVAGDTRVLIWDERQPEQKQVYETFLGEAIGVYLSKQPGFSVKSVWLEMPDYGLDDATLDATDVIVWWGHKKNAAVAPARVEEVVKRVMAGRLGFIAIHSSIHARPFLRLMEERAKQDAFKELPEAERPGLGIEFHPSPPRGVLFVPSVERSGEGIKLMRPSGWIGGWRADAQPSLVRVLLPEHPIAKGLPNHWSIPKTEMYSEPFHVPDPDAVVFEERWEKGEHFRSGCTWSVGHGRVFYFRPGHETYPVFLQEENLRVIENAAAWIIDNR